MAEFSWPVFLVFIGIAAALPMMFRSGQGRIIFSIDAISGGDLNMQLNQGNTKKLGISEVLDAGENPITLSAGVVPTWTVSDPSAASISPADDGMTADITAGNKATSITVTATAGKASGSISVDIPAGEATTLVIKEVPATSAAAQAASDPAQTADAAA